jgi:hypothetical protein
MLALGVVTVRTGLCSTLSHWEAAHLQVHVNSPLRTHGGVLHLMHAWSACRTVLLIALLSTQKTDSDGLQQVAGSGALHDSNDRTIVQDLPVSTSTCETCTCFWTIAGVAHNAEYVHM